MQAEFAILAKKYQEAIQNSAEFKAKALASEQLVKEVVT